MTTTGLATYLVAAPSIHPGWMLANLIVWGGIGSCSYLAGVGQMAVLDSCIRLIDGKLEAAWNEMLKGEDKYFFQSLWFRWLRWAV
jgi:hypothetical protein